MRGRAHPARLRLRVGAAVRDAALWAPGESVAVAVSGGLDSVVLLDVLVATRRWHGGRLEVVTVNHGVRPGSAADADFVWGLARRHGLPVRRVDLSPGPASEAELRIARYEALAESGTDRVALAHHRDDLAETVVLQMIRGTSVHAFAPMRPRHGRYVRPLLGVPREAIAAYAAARGLSWREDPSNTDPRHLRNRVRAEVMPLLESLRPGAAAAIARLALALGDR